MNINNFITNYDYSDKSNEYIVFVCTVYPNVGDLQARINELTIDMKKKLNHTPGFGKAGL